MGRAVLKHLKASTLLTLFDLLKSWKLSSNNDYTYNAMDGTIKFFNGSEIFLRELGLDPSDPEFDKLGSTEYTGAFIDECSQVSTKAKNIIMSRLRYKLEEFNIIPKLLMCSNPTKNFLYYEFYKPFKTKELLSYRKFIPALVQDNPYISPHYIENLKKLDRISKERLLFGNWEYDDDTSKLFEYDNILNMFSNSFVFKENEKKYLSVDVARFGNDKIFLVVWQGLFILQTYVYSKKDTEFTKKEIERIRLIYNIPRSQVVIDEDGVGGGVVDGLVGVKGFVNNSRAFDIQKVDKKHTVVHNYGNLKSQCYYKLADYVAENKIGAYKEIPVEIKERIIEDLEQIKRKDPDKDGKLYVTPKEEIKDNLGRSPDYSDAIMMRMFFEVVSLPSLVFGNLELSSSSSNTNWSVNAKI